MLIKESKQLSIYEVICGYDVYLNGNLINISNYIELCALLRRPCLKGDRINIYINSRGGNSAIGIQIANSIKHSAWYINCIVAGSCDSAATLIALSGDYLIMEDYTCMYFHNWSQEVRASGKEMKLFIENQDRKMSTAFKHFYSPFLTDSELELLANDGEIYIHADDPTLEERINRHFNLDSA